MEVEVELQGKSKVPSNSMVLPNRESVNDEAFDTSRLLEEVLERNNMLLALKRVIRGIANISDKTHAKTKIGLNLKFLPMLNQ